MRRPADTHHNQRRPMTYSARLHPWGERACSSWPELEPERSSCDAITPSVARGVCDAIHWHPGMRWPIDRIHVVKPIHFETLCRKEIAGYVALSKASVAMRRASTDGLRQRIEAGRAQRATASHRDIAYRIAAHAVPTDTADTIEPLPNHIAMFRRRAARSQSLHRPYPETRECAANYASVDGAMPASTLRAEERIPDLGWMPHDLDFTNHHAPGFFRARVRNGVLHVPASDEPEVRG